MTVIVASKKDYKGSVTPVGLNVETTIIEIDGESDDYMVEGYLDLSSLGDGEEVEIREYIAVDGSSFAVFISATFTGVLDNPVIRFHTKTLLSSMKYKVTMIQKSGILRTFPYGFIEEILGSM